MILRSGCNRFRYHYLHAARALLLLHDTVKDKFALHFIIQGCGNVPPDLVKAISKSASTPTIPAPCMGRGGIVRSGARVRTVAVEHISIYHFGRSLPYCFGQVKRTIVIGGPVCRTDETTLPPFPGTPSARVKRAKKARTSAGAAAGWC